MSPRMVSAREIVGKRIVAFDPGAFNDGRGGRAHDPVITLDDGSQLVFVTEETEIDCYGVLVSRKRRKP